MSYLSNITRSKGDPKVIETGPSSLGAADRAARALGWFSIGLGVTELVAPGSVTRLLGMEGSEPLIRAYGAREIAAGVLSLSVEKQLGMWSRVVGDGLDIATVVPALRESNPKRGAAGVALAVLAGVTLLDLAVAEAVSTRHKRRGQSRSYRDRSGFPKGLSAAREVGKRRAELSPPQPASSSPTAAASAVHAQP